MAGQGGGVKVGEIDADHRVWLDSQPLVTRCAFCPWTFEGTVASGREAARAHRLAEHPKAGRKRRPKNAGLFAASPRRVLSADDEKHRQDALVEAAARRAALVPKCRRDGCPLEPVHNGRGRFSGLCHEHKLEEGRRWGAEQAEARRRPAA